MVPNYSADLLDASLSKPVCAAVTNVPHARAVAEDSGLRPFCSCFQFKQCNLHICNMLYHIQTPRSDTISAQHDIPDCDKRTVIHSYTRQTCATRIK